MKQYANCECPLSNILMSDQRTSDSDWRLTCELCNYGLHEDFRSLTEHSSSSRAGGCISIYEGWNFNSGNYLFTTDTK